MAAGVVPQSSCSFKPIAPASICSRSGAALEAFPLPRKPRFTGKASAASSMRCMFHAPGVQVVASVPVAGPVPPPIRVVRPPESAVVISCGQMKCTCESMPPAVTIFPSPAITSVPAPTIMPGVTPAIMSGLPALPIPTMRLPRMPMSALRMPEWSMITALVMTRSSAPSASTAVEDWPIPSRRLLPPPNFASSPGVVRSFSISMKSSVSARRTLSPVVGP